ncbi:MAG: hypothetical protein ACK55I_22385, partial [bacterium]
MKVLDIILDKGKGPIIGKLRTIQLVEADLQLLIRIFVGNRTSGLIEDDPSISKFNFRSRKLYSIDEVILEKRLIYKSTRWIR